MGGVTDIIMVMLVLAGAYILIKSGKLGEILGGNFQLPALPGLPAPVAPTPVPAPTPEGGGGGEDESEQGGAGEETPEAAPAPSGGGGGAPIDTGTSCPGGETCKQDGQGRYDCDGPKGDSYEATWCGTFSGDDLTIKMYGPQHSNDGDCCWCVMHVKEDGTMVPGGEGPHPSSNCEHAGGKGAGKAPCYKAIMKPGPIQEGYALIGGKWQLMVSRKGPCGCSKTANNKTGDQVTFRCDGNFQTKCATVKPLGGGGGGAAPAAGPRTIGAGAVSVGCSRRSGPSAYDRILARL